MLKVNRHKARYRAYRLKRVPTGRKGEPRRKIIAEHSTPSAEYYLHATKGYRYKRLIAD